MNKQELIEKIEALPDNIGLIRPHIDKKIVLGLVRQLDEPEKVKIPQFVADWIERERKAGGDLEDLFDDIVCEQQHLEWFREEENMNLVARAWLDGYEVDEKRYLVKVKGICGNHETLNREKHSNKWLFSDREENSLYGTHHTRKELEDAGFGWVFDCEGIEIEEV